MLQVNHGDQCKSGRGQFSGVYIDLINPYIIKAKDKTSMNFMCLIVIDPATSWFEIVKLPNKDITYVQG